MKKNRETAAIKELLERVPGIQSAFIHGPCSKNLKHSKDGVEITVVGAPDPAELDEIVSKVEEKLAKPADVTLFTVRELQERIVLKEPLVTRILKEPKVVLVERALLANWISTHYND